MQTIRRYQNRAIETAQVIEELIRLAREMQRRGIAEEDVQQVLHAPEQRFPVRAGRDILQSRITLSGKRYLLRAFVDVDRHPAEVMTVYRTGKISKYWRNEP